MKITRNSRKHERIRVGGLIRYPLDQDPSRFQTKNIYEISEGGLSFSTYSKLEVGTTFRVSVLLLSREMPIDINAVVVRCPQKLKRPITYQVSLRFLDMSEKEQAALRDALIFFLKNKTGLRPFHVVIRLHK
jgi:c-di-GMP-binding flagellar brake protein YcgR